MRFLIASLLLISFKLTAQIPDKFVHFGIAINSYKGDLGTYDKYTGGFQIGVQLNKKKRLNGAFNLGYGIITDDNVETQPTGQIGSSAPNNFFKTNIFHINYDLHLNIIKREQLIIYLSQGIGFIRFTPKNDGGENLQDLQNTRAAGENYRNSSIMLPTSLGIIYFLPNNYGISLQAGLYNTVTDYLDNISKFGDSGNDNILAMRITIYVPISQNLKK